jgi:hypothetical protein
VNGGNTNPPIKSLDGGGGDGGKGLGLPNGACLGWFNPFVAGMIIGTCENSCDDFELLD